MYIKIGFVIIALLLAILLTGYESYLLIKKEGRKNHPVYVSFMTGLFVIYVIFALVLVFFIKGYFSKIIMFLFALSPFIIGKFATYEKRTLFCLIQVICLVLSVYICLWYNINI